MSGTLKIKALGREYELGIVKSFSDRYSKSVATTPIPTMSEDATYGIESGSNIVINAEFTRKSPDTPQDSSSDSSRWSNGKWYLEIQKIINRWQARTDGCELIYSPGADNPYVPARDYNGYIKTLSRTFNPGDPTMLYVSMEFHVGTMTVNKKKVSTWPSVPVNSFEITMSNEDQSKWFCLMKGVINCISAYTIEGGMEQPFETITMEIPKNRLSSVAEDLVNHIVAGKNKIILNAVGRSTMTVTKCKLSGKTYRVTAYCDAERIKGYTISARTTYTPWYWITHILTSGEFGMAYSTEGSDPTFISSVTPAEGEFDDITFDEGQNVWYILQVCALYLGCKIFFANGKAYCIDYRSTRSVSAIHEAGFIDLYTQDSSDPLYGRVTGSVTLGDEGVDTVINTQVIKCTDETGKTISKEYKAPDLEVTRAGKTLNIPELVEGGGYTQATTVAKNLVDYRLEPQQSISFKLREMQDTGSSLAWQAYFDPSTRADEIRSIADEADIVNKSATGVRRPQMLLLSQYERSYPEGTTKYTFGVISNIDLATSTSQILSNQ